MIARAPEIYPWLAKTLTARGGEAALQGHLPRAASSATRCPNLGALNFLLHESLGGGGTVSLRLDAQGKTLSHALLAMEVRAPRALLAAAKRGDAADGVPVKRAKPLSAKRR